MSAEHQTEMERAFAEANAAMLAAVGESAELVEGGQRKPVHVVANTDVELVGDEYRQSREALMADLATSELPSGSPQSIAERVKLHVRGRMWAIVDVQHLGGGASRLLCER